MDPTSVGSPAFFQSFSSLAYVTFCPNSLPAFAAPDLTAPTALPMPLLAAAPTLSIPMPATLPAPFATALVMFAAPVAAFLAMPLMSISSTL